ncbi:GNAT family N-acetyltransferase [candidate division WOR-3 bacterium]|nr:GNAT family N-acetyltransferase [candidate division WOR-3 bacterium]
MDKNYTLRECTIDDLPFITDISKNTWDGHDFLEDVFSDWIEDGNFWALESERRVIGTVKISVYPCKTAWLEGLRVHKDYQSKGWGRILYDFTAKKAAELQSNGTVTTAEFATYYLNEESLSLSTRDGFRLEESFTSFSAETDKFEPCAEEEIKQVNDFKLFVEKCGYQKHIPLGWEFVKKCSDTHIWLERKSLMFSYKGMLFLQPKHAFRDIMTPLVPASDYTLTLMPAFSKTARGSNEEYLTVMIPGYSKEMLKELKKIGFNTWHEGKEDDVLVMKKF